jgi:type I restriction enzyme, S subunit
MNMARVQLVPRQWRTLRLKSAVELKSIRENGSSLSENYVGLERIESWTGRLLASTSDKAQSEDGESETKGMISHFEAGDILFGKLRPYLAKAHLAKESGVCTTELLVLKPHQDIDGRFFLNAILTKEFIEHVNAETFGVKMPRADWDTIGNSVMLFPPVSKQRQIADYLDRETQKIDSLIAAKKRLLELLAEKRRSMITQAVTRGWTADVPMKNPGVEWLGEIPEHWLALPLKFLCESLQTGPFGSQLHAEDYVDGGIPSINPAHLSSGRIVPDVQVSVDQAAVERLSVHKLQLGDIVFARRGEMGRCGLVTPKEIGWLCGSGSLRARPRQDILKPEYLVLVMLNTFASKCLSLMSVGTTMDNLNTEIIGALQIPVPPLKDQEEICKKLEKRILNLEQLSTVAQKTIALLQERRTALISAAVTGQLSIPD